eukprot:m.160570 g.160570  ORF g.160570 m.160570 type:complete len:66 (-) comp31185_c0_seq1:53-250(-)
MFGSFISGSPKNTPAGRKSSTDIISTLNGLLLCASTVTANSNVTNDTNIDTILNACRPTSHDLAS